jgi:hypothetical protein
MQYIAVLQLFGVFFKQSTAFRVLNYSGRGKGVVEIEE